VTPEDPDVLAWLAERGAEPGHCSATWTTPVRVLATRLSTDGVARVVARLGFAVGLRVARSAA